jgi:hypothetical protein
LKIFAARLGSLIILALCAGPAAEAALPHPYRSSDGLCQITFPAPPMTFGNITTCRIDGMVYEVRDFDMRGPGFTANGYLDGFQQMNPGAHRIVSGKHQGLEATETFLHGVRCERIFILEGHTVLSISVSNSAGSALPHGADAFFSSLHLK